MRRLAELQNTLAHERDRFRIINEICNAYELDNVAYLGMTLPGTSLTGPVAINTYPSHWADRYREKSYVKIDPVVQWGFQSALPLDWGVNFEDMKVQQLFSEAREIGVGNHGLTVPIRGARGEVALFSVSTTAREKVWQKFRLEMFGELIYLAHHLHENVLQDFPPSLAIRPRLSPRETEVLKWFANGKVCIDVAEILSISEHTVRTYSESARAKLDALTIAHAVARAISFGLIPPPE